LRENLDNQQGPKRAAELSRTPAVGIDELLKSFEHAVSSMAGQNRVRAPHTQRSANQLASGHGRNPSWDDTDVARKQRLHRFLRSNFAFNRRAP